MFDPYHSHGGTGFIEGLYAEPAGIEVRSDKTGTEEIRVSEYGTSPKGAEESVRRSVGSHTSKQARPFVRTKHCGRSDPDQS